MIIGEQILFTMAKMLYNSNPSITEDQKKSLESIEMYEKEREKNITDITDSLREYNIDIKGKTIVDFGCSTGAVTREYISKGAKKVIGLDIDKDAIKRAEHLNENRNIEYILNTNTTIPIENSSVDVIASNSVFEHVTKPEETLAEFHRVLVHGGKVFIGTWGWYHPFAPHLFSVMPVPWCQVLFSEKTIMKTCNKIYNSDWYKPVYWDFDENGNRVEKYNSDYISSEYVNKLLIRDFEKIFNNSPFKYNLYPRSFSNKFLRWTKPFTKVPFVKEFLTSYIYVVLEKVQK